jgi:hypothetical protein
MTLLTRAVAVVALVVGSLAVGSGDASANHSWNGYHWARPSNPYTVAIGKNLTTAEWQSHLTQTSSDWNVSTILKNSVGTGNGTDPATCSPTISTVQVCNAAYGLNNWLGLASVWIYRGSKHIAQGTVKVNDSYLGPGASYQYNNSAEREHVVCQEVGHTFGLDHQSTDGSSLDTCMDYYHNTSDTDTLSTRPNQHDYDELVTIYTHLDTPKGKPGRSSSAPVPVDGVGPDGTPRGASPERGNWYVLDAGPDHQLLVHVFWK